MPGFIQVSLGQFNSDGSLSYPLAPHNSAAGRSNRPDSRVSMPFPHPNDVRDQLAGKSVSVPGKHVPHFKAGKEMREQVNRDSISATPENFVTERRNDEILAISPC